MINKKAPENRGLEVFLAEAVSDILYEKMLQDGLQLILDRTPTDQRDTVLAALTWHGYDPHYSPYEPEEGECASTGIDIYCCPCGRHE